MTNGEKIKETFPNLRITEFESYICVMGENYEFNNAYPKKWWNAEYKEPTTKNDLEVDCIDRQAAITFVCKNTKEILKDTMALEVKPSDDYLYENVSKIMRNPKVLPSVTPIRSKGHWTDDGYCTCCNNQTLPLDVSGYASGYDSFCPNCGADNREVEE